MYVLLHHYTVRLSHSNTVNGGEMIIRNVMVGYILQNLFWPERKKALPPVWHVVSHGDITRGASLWEDPVHVV